MFRESETRCGVEGSLLSTRVRAFQFVKHVICRPPHAFARLCKVLDTTRDENPPKKHGNKPL